MITVVAEFTVKPNKAEEFKKYAIDVTRASKKEKGCLSYTVLNAVVAADKFTFIEEWLNGSAIDEHKKSAHFTEFISKITPILEAPPKIEQFKKIPSVFF